MPRLSIGERVRVTSLGTDRARRRLVSRMLYSPALRWRYGSNVADQLLIIPQDLRTRDPSFWNEIEVDQFGLAGSLAILNGESPFDTRAPSEAWERALHGFGWLRHLHAAEEDGARETARRLAVEWTSRYRGGGSSIAWEPDTIARRIISWITHANLLLEDSDPKTYDAITESLGFQIVRLSATWRMAPAGLPRLLSLMGIVLGHLTIADHDAQLADAERLLASELSRQILPDGGHISRNPSALVEILLDLLPLSQCFVARNRKVPAEVATAIDNALAMLRFMRVGDGSLARFNGAGIADPANIATVLAYGANTGRSLLESAQHSGYARLTGGNTILVADVGAPPPLEFAGTAHAGCLSFELSHGPYLIFANGGAPRQREAELVNKSRATVSHNTLCLGDKSSSKMVRHPFLEELVGGHPIRFPDVVFAETRQTDQGTRLEASHDGYAHRFKLVHERILELSSDGLRLKGTDRIRGRSTEVRLRKDIPYSLHFRLHPNIGVSSPTPDNSVDIELPDGTAWTFNASGAKLSVEEAVYFADSTGMLRTWQIVLRGTTFGSAEIKWEFFGA